MDGNRRRPNHHAAARNRLAERVLDLADHHQVLPGDDRRHDSSAIHARCPAAAMDVVLDIFRDIEIDHVLDSRNVDAAAGDVGGHENAVRAFAKIVERLRALALRSVGMDACDRMPLPLQDVVQPLRIDFSSREHERRAELLMEERE